MATKKKPLAEYASYDLMFLERKLEEMQKYVDKNPIDQIIDRYNNVRTGEVVQTIEGQVKSITDITIKIGQLTEMVARMRRDDDPAEKLEVRGGSTLSAMDKGLI